MAVEVEDHDLWLVVGLLSVHRGDDSPWSVADAFVDEYLDRWGVDDDGHDDSTGPAGGVGAVAPDQ